MVPASLERRHTGRVVGGRERGIVESPVTAANEAHGEFSFHESDGALR